MNPILMLVKNNQALTEEAIESVLAQTIPVRLLVVDNASNDGASQYLNSLDDDRVEVVHFSPPKSVAASWNWGLTRIFERVGYALVVNNDVLLRPDTYELLLADGGGFVTCVGVQGEHYHERCSGMKVFRDEAGREVFPSTPNSASKRPHPDFSCFLIRKWVWDKVGLFDEEFKGAYCEDGDYDLRMYQSGIRAYCLDVPYLHYGAATIKNAGVEEAETIKKQANRNRSHFTKKWGFPMGSPAYYQALDKGEPDDQVDGLLLMLTGLPGAGKTCYMDSLKREWSVFDDILRDTRQIETVIVQLRAGMKCAVSDIAFCQEETREGFASRIQAELPGFSIRKVFYAADMEACRANLLRRNRPSLAMDLKMLEQLGAQYKVPEGAEVMPCFHLAPLKVSLDYDGTMWSHMRFFRELMGLLQASGHQVGCLTGHGEECQEADVSLMLARGFPKPDFWFGKPRERASENGALWKSDVILKEGIALHFDDFDFGNKETEQLFREKLGDQFYRVVRINHREPPDVHFE